MCILYKGRPLIPFFENNPVLFSTVIAAVTLVIGVLSIVVSVRRYFKEKQIEASCGFYINLLIFLELFKLEINDSMLFQLFFDPSVRESVFGAALIPEERAKVIAPQFSSLCKEFLKFLSTANNNVPPNNNWKEWHVLLLDLVRFLHKGAVINELFPYTSVDKEDEYNSECNNIIITIERIKTLVEKNINSRKSRKPITRKLNAQKSELLTKRQDTDMKSLYEFMAKEGLSAEDVLAKLK